MEQNKIILLLEENKEITNNICLVYLTFSLNILFFFFNYNTFSLKLKKKKIINITTVIVKFDKCQKLNLTEVN